MTQETASTPIEREIVKYLTENAVDGRLPESGIVGKTRYLDDGILNSLGLIMFIEFTEDRFRVRFSAEDLQSYDFRTPAGLSSIIERLGGSV